MKWMACRKTPKSPADPDTNRPEQIEPALVSRPGRIDQAIEFPLPDEEGRTKLTKLYAGGLEISDGVLETAVSRTKGVSAAFIKELMRRCAQFQIESSRDSVLTQAAVDAAMRRNAFHRRSTERRLLGGADAEPASRLLPRSASASSSAFRGRCLHKQFYLPGKSLPESPTQYLHGRLALIGT